MQTNRESTFNTLKYLFFHMRCGIFVMIRRRRVVMFVPFANKDYENNWGDNITFDSSDGSMNQYYRGSDRILARPLPSPSIHAAVNTNTADRVRWWYLSQRNRTTTGARTSFPTRATGGRTATLSATSTADTGTARTRRSTGATSS